MSERDDADAQADDADAQADDADVQMDDADSPAGETMIPETSEATQGTVYVESTIIMTTVRVVAPFVLTFGLFVMLHGADTPGGGFQGGVLVGAVVMMLAFAFGADATRAWADRRVVTGLATGGVLTFVLVGLGSIALGGGFLEYHVYGFEGASKYGIELVELAIGAIVAGIVTGLFFMISLGVERTYGETGGESQ